VQRDVSCGNLALDVGWAGTPQGRVASGQHRPVVRTALTGRVWSNVWCRPPERAYMRRPGQGPELESVRATHESPSDTSRCASVKRQLQEEE